MRALFTALAWIAIVTLIIAVVYQSSFVDRFGFPSCWGLQYANHGNPGPLRPSGMPFVLEGFESQENIEKKEIQGIPDETDSKSGNPATSEAKYSLLEDSLSKKTSPGKLSAHSCFQSDFLAQSDKVGNYIQRTNNIRHATPDSCTAPLTELVDSFYINQVLP
jgi:hypothetical protein